MYMENKILIFMLFIFLSCNNTEKNKVSCKLENTSMGNVVIFKNFSSINMGKVIFQDLILTKEKYVYLNPNFDDNGDDEIRLEINRNVAALIEKGCMIIINDKLRYKISGVKVEKIQRSTMWNKKLFCELQEYKVNDSIIKNNQYIVIYK